MPRQEIITSLEVGQKSLLTGDGKGKDLTIFAFLLTDLLGEASELIPSRALVNPVLSVKSSFSNNN